MLRGTMCAPLQKAHQTFLNVTDSDIVKLLQRRGSVGKVEIPRWYATPLSDNQIDLALMKLGPTQWLWLTVTEAGRVGFCKPSTAAETLN
jgi:hypothetical protein